MRDYSAQLGRLQARRGYWRQRVRDGKQAVEDAQQLVKDAEEGQRIIQQVAQVVQQEVHHHIAGVVSRCLEAIYDDPYEFVIEFEQKRGRTEANLIFLRNGKSSDPQDGMGGGVLDVAALACRISALVLSQPPLRRFLGLDEPFRCLYKSNTQRVAQLILSLARDLGIQFLIITHNPALQTGKVIELE